MSKTTSEYKKYRKLAERNGWSLPKAEVFGEIACVDYWKQCEIYDLDNLSGRPVPPHRTGR